MKVIAFSLWGDNTRYTLGALQNANLAKVVYPEWVCRFYVGQSTSRIIVDMLREFDNVEIVEMEEQGDWTGMFWRFIAASDPNIEVLIVRDCDSRLWFREKEAVDEWLASDKDFHIMRDNQQHGVPILGGMWGVRNKLLYNIEEMIKEYSKGDFWQVDQNFLRDVVFPIVADQAFIHDEFFGGNPYPTPRDENHFVGQAYAGSGKILDAEEYFQDFMNREYNA
mgnify:CR=1 FL=1|tara:strand:+ start:761 stop:1429 length:669 start_codon:yes stop_codon:yes gene_type:complete